MNFLEKDLEQIIYDADKELLADKGLIIDGKLKRQFRIGNYGIADLIEFKKPYYCLYFKKYVKGEISIYELKKEQIGISAFLQALGYLKGIRTFLKLRNLENHFNYSITLIGKEIDQNSNYIYLSDFLNTDTDISDINQNPKFSLFNYTYQYDIDGIKFITQSDYNLKYKGF